MRATISQTALSQALSYVQTALPNRPPLPILSSLLFTVTEKEIIISATDLYFGVQAHCPAQVKETGTLAIPGKQITELVKGLPSGEIVLSSAKNTLTITAKHIESTVQFQEADEFPSFPEVTGEKTSIEQAVILTLVQQVAMSCSPDAARPLLTGILWEPGVASAFVATDGFRLSHWVSGTTWQLQERLIIPARFWMELEKVALQEKQSNIILHYSAEQKQIAATVNAVTLYSRTLDGEYPPYQKIMPTEFAISVVLQAEELLEQVRRSLLYARDSLGTVRLTFGADKSVLQAQSTSLGSFEAVLTSAQLTGEPIEIAFNSKYVLDFLQLVKAGEITIHLNGELKPALLTAQKHPGFSYVVMPFRVNQ